jgi:uncharacterized protein
MAKTELPVLSLKSTNGQVNGKGKQLPLLYDCGKCPAYCCSYDWILVTKRDIKRLAARFGLSYEKAEAKFTKYIKEYGNRVLRHRKDHVFKSTCQFLHPTERRCTIYEHRPAICREYPDSRRCRYYEFLKWERDHQDDESFVPMLG